MTCEEHLIENALILKETQRDIGYNEFCKQMKKDPNYQYCKTDANDLWYFVNYILYSYLFSYKSKIVEEMEKKYGYVIKD